VSTVIIPKLVEPDDRSWNQVALPYPCAVHAMGIGPFVSSNREHGIFGAEDHKFGGNLLEKGETLTQLQDPSEETPDHRSRLWAN
jgi:hypothetical protein